ncbi:hypothetical protein [Bacillus mycoides]|uniref:hypothetical protein n=1 Tax=Bacillus mycoides TaxID=1405 RepID=UPI003823900A
MENDWKVTYQTTNIVACIKEMAEAWIKLKYNGHVPDITIQSTEVSDLSMVDAAVQSMERTTVGNQELVASFKQLMRNESETKINSQKISFNESITNTVSFTTVRAHTFTGGLKITIGGKAELFGDEGMWEKETSFSCGYNREEQDKVEQAITGTICKETTSTVLPDTNVEAVLEVYAYPVSYSVKSLFYFDGTVKIIFIDSNGNPSEENPNLYTIFTGISQEDLFTKWQHEKLWACNFIHSVTGVEMKGLAFEGEAQITTKRDWFGQINIQNIEN